MIIAIAIDHTHLSSAILGAYKIGKPIDYAVINHQTLKPAIIAAHAAAPKPPATPTPITQDTPPAPAAAPSAGLFNLSN